MANIKFFNTESFPLEMHKVCTVQQLTIPSVERRVEALYETGFNSYRLTTDDLYLDMLTDSGVNAMSNEQLASMLRADEAYAGSATYKRLSAKIKEIFNKDYFLPVHQGRACENMLARGLVKEGDIIPMNFFFGSTVNQIKQCGGTFRIMLCDEGLKLQSDVPFKGNFDLEKLESFLKAERGRVPFMRIEAGTNLIGGQPIALDNMLAAVRLCKEYGALAVLDASLLQDNLYFIKTREEAYKNASIREITRKLADAVDIIYFSARKLGFARGGGICLNDSEIYERLKAFVARFEGFPTYGGMSVREMEAICVGLDDTMNEDVISQGPQMIAFLCGELQKHGVPVVTPPGGLGCHIDAMKFVPHIPYEQYPAGSLACAIYIASGSRGMERGCIDEPWEDGKPAYGAMELVRLAVPRRVYTVSQMRYMADRVAWLYEHRDIIGGIKFESEQHKNFFDRLTAVNDWPYRLAEQFRRDFGDSL